MLGPDATEPSVSQEAAFKHIIYQFGAAWSSGKRPAIEDFLPESGALRHAVLVELAHIDLELRREAGEEVSADTYFRRFPELAADAAAARSLRGETTSTCTVFPSETEPPTSKDDVSAPAFRPGRSLPDEPPLAAPPAADAFDPLSRRPGIRDSGARDIPANVHAGSVAPEERTNYSSVPALEEERKYGHLRTGVRDSAGRDRAAITDTGKCSSAERTNYLSDAEPSEQREAGAAHRTGIRDNAARDQHLDQPTGCTASEAQTNYLSDPQADEERNQGIPRRTGIRDSGARSRPVAENSAPVERTSYVDNVPAENDPLRGSRRTLIRDYELLEKIGQGGMGVVYKAQHTQLKKTVAIKLISQEFPNPELKERFRRELQAAGALDHPNIVRATDGGEVNQTLYLVMEYLQGQTLDAVVKQRGPLPVDEACDYIRQAALGLSAIYNAGLVHRDIKPSNLFLTDTGVIKLLDLGVARNSNAEIKATQPGQLLGTADYMAPEQTHTAGGVDIRADIYSLGCVFYYMLAGEPPFPAPLYTSTAQKLIAHDSSPFPDIRSKRLDVPNSVATLLIQMVAKDPSLRRKNPQRIAEKLKNFERPPKVIPAARPPVPPLGEDESVRLLDYYKQILPPNIVNPGLIPREQPQPPAGQAELKPARRPPEAPPPSAKDKRLQPPLDLPREPVELPKKKSAAQPAPAAPPNLRAHVPPAPVIEPDEEDEALAAPPPPRVRPPYSPLPKRDRKSAAKRLLLVTVALVAGLLALLIWGL